jgi:Ser/Thr protein kinase RdoA (MazF antagonist)
MLPLSEIARLNATVSGDRRSGVADTVAAAWGYPPGSARFWRSSASHVSVLPGADGTGHEAFLRFVPASAVRRAGLEVVAVLMARLADRGLDTVPVLRSSKGNLIETISTGTGRVHAMVVAAAPGSQVDAGDLTPDLARAWGAALARLHRDGDAAATGLRLPDGPERVHRAFAALHHDRSIAEPLVVLRSWLDRRQRELLANLRGEPCPLRTALDSYASRQRQIAADLAPLLR